MSAPADTQVGNRQSTFRGGGWRLALVKVVVSASLVWLILQRFSFQDLRAQVLRTEIGALVLPFAILLTSNLLGALQWGWLLRVAGLASRRGRLVGLYLAGIFLSHFAVGNVGGDVYKVLSLGRSEGALGPVAGATIVDRVVGAAALCTLALVAACSALIGGRAPLGLTLCVLLCSLGVAGCAAVVLHAEWSSRLETSLKKLPLGRLSPRLARLMGHLRGYGQRVAVLRGVFLLSLLVQAARVMAHYFVGVAMGWTLHTADLGRFFLIIPVLGMVVALPVSIGGWGVREWAGVALFAPLGRPGEEAVALLALTAGLAFLASLAGAICLVVEAWPRPASASVAR